MGGFNVPILKRWMIDKFRFRFCRIVTNHGSRYETYGFLHVVGVGINARLECPDDPYGTIRHFSFDDVVGIKFADSEDGFMPRDSVEVFTNAGI